MRSTRVVAFSLVALIVFSACAVPLQQTKKPEGGGTFVVALDSPVLTLDAANVTELASAQVTAQVYETLVQHNAASGAFEPLLAQSWAVSPDGRVWTFTLRSGVTFQDGTALDADAVVENVNRWLDTSNPYHAGDFDYWQILFGGFKGNGSIVRSVDKVDELRFRLTLEQPFAPLLAALSMFPFGIASPAAMHANADELRRHPVGTGPFQFVEWKADGEIDLQAYAQYWGGQPALAGVHFLPIPSITARLDAVRSGKVQLAEGYEHDLVAVGRQIKGVKVVLRPSQTIAYLAINQKSPPLDDAKVRLAIAQAINRKALVDDGYDGLAQVADQFVPPSVAGNDKGLAPIVYGPDAAQKTLADAGQNGAVMSTLWYPSTARPFLPNPRSVAEEIEKDLRAAGIIVAVNSTDWLTYQQSAIQGRYPLYLQGWTGDSPDADSFLSGLFTGDSVTRSIGYTNLELKTTLATGRSQSDAGQRSSTYKQAAATIRDDMPRIPLVYPQTAVLLAGNINGFTASSTGAESYRSITLSP